MPLLVVPDTWRQRNAPPGIVTAPADAGEVTAVPPLPGKSARATDQEMRLVRPVGAKHGVIRL